MHKKLIFIFMILVIVFLAGCSPEGTAAPGTKTGTGKIRAGKTFDLYEGPRAETLLPPPGQLSGGSTAEIMELNGEWALVRQGNIEGWIPKWYISDDPGPVKDLESEHMVLNRSAPGLLYPGGPQAVSLDKGRLLLPLKQWNGWVQVEIIIYSIPGVMTAWVDKEFLSPVNGLTPVEGFLKQGSTAFVGCEFEEIGNSLPEEAAYNMPVQIRREKNGLMYVEAAGGWSAWTKKENISFARQDRS